MKEIVRIIMNDDFPDENLKFSDTFHECGGEFRSYGYALVDGKIYTFSYGHEWGIDEDSIEEETFYTNWDEINEDDL